MVGHSKGIYSIQYNNDGTKLISASSDKTIRLWDLNSLDCVGIMKTDEIVIKLKFCPTNYDLFAALSLNQKVTVWSVETFRPIFDINLPNSNEQLKNSNSFGLNINFDEDGKNILILSNGIVLKHGLNSSSQFQVYRFINYNLII